MRSLALTGIYLASAGLVTLAVEVYDFEPVLLIVWAASGLLLVAAALVWRDGS